jgi:hypothetical protein
VQPTTPNLIGVWAGTLTIAVSELSNTCNQNWVITSQNDGQFSGTFQMSGRKTASCGQAGNLSGSVSTTGVISNLTYSVVIGATTCARVAGGIFSGVLFNSGTLSAQASDTLRCPGLSDFTWSLVTSMAKQ